MLEFKNIKKSFVQSGEENTILNHFNLRIDSGEFVAIIGSNGSGKTTLLNILAGSISPDEGAVLLDGKDITPEKEYLRSLYISRVYQDPSMGTCKDMSVRENLSMAIGKGRNLTLKRCVNKNDDKLFVKELKKVELGLEDKLSQRTGDLSGGQRQCLAMLMATLSKSKIIILDEHTAALDPKTAEKVMKQTENIVKSSGATSLMVTHNLRHAIDYSDRIIMLHSGEIVLDISAGEADISLLTEKFSQLSLGM